MAAERLSTELDAARAREEDISREAEASKNELESMKKQIMSMEEQLHRQVAVVGIL
jgi:predicted  nucleic acid-binding Zn-ribbon protein